MTAIHGAWLAAVQAHAGVVVTVTSAVPPRRVISRRSGSMANVHASGAAWCTANAELAITSVLSRAALPAFAATENSTRPGPVTAGADVSATQPVAPSTDQAHVAPVATLTAPAPPSLENDWLDAERVKEQEGDGPVGEDDPHAEATTRSVSANVPRSVRRVWDRSVVMATPQLVSLLLIRLQGAPSQPSLGTVGPEAVIPVVDLAAGDRSNAARPHGTPAPTVSVVDIV